MTFNYMFMCELNAVLTENGVETPLMEGVVKVVVSGDGRSVELYDIFAGHMHVEGTIAVIDITKQALIINGR